MATHLIKFKISFAAIIILQLYSCCSSSDSRVPAGHPYGDWHELNHSIFKPCRQSSTAVKRLLSGNRMRYLKDRTICDSLIKIINPTCDCSSVDFSKNILVGVEGIITDYDYTNFYPRVVINNSEQKCIVEVRGYGKRCNNKNSNSPNEYDDVIVIPRPPDHYKIEIKYFDPVEASY